jgi:hypothetical protein
MAKAMATAMAEGNTAEMAVAMVHGNRSNGSWQQGRQWAIATATVMAMATAMAMATELETEMAMAMAMAMEMATARSTITKEGLPLHVAAMCSAF